MNIFHKREPLWVWILGRDNISCNIRSSNNSLYEDSVYMVVALAYDTISRTNRSTGKERERAIEVTWGKWEKNENWLCKARVFLYKDYHKVNKDEEKLRLIGGLEAVGVPRERMCRLEPRFNGPSCFSDLEFISFHYLHVVSAQMT